MLVHVTPKILCEFGNAKTLAVAAVEIWPGDMPGECVALRGGQDVMARRPYPNKTISVVCRKQGRKAADGLLLSFGWPVEEFRVATHWSIAGCALATHVVNYRLADGYAVYPTASDNPHLWDEEDRLPGNKAGLGSGWGFPRMEIDGKRARAGDKLDEQGWIVYREEECRIPTIPRERLVNPPGWIDRLPRLADAFRLDINCFL